MKDLLLKFSGSLLSLILLCGTANAQSSWGPKLISEDRLTAIQRMEDFCEETI
jgi:hypothetical protein